MNASALFTIAHAMTRESVKRFGGDYRVTFAAALRIAYQESKKMTSNYLIPSKKNGLEVLFSASDLIPEKFLTGEYHNTLAELLAAKADHSALADAKIVGDQLIVTCREKLRTNEKGSDGKRIWIAGDDARVVNRFIDAMRAVNWE